MVQTPIAMGNGFLFGKTTGITGPVSSRRNLPARTEEKEGNLQVGKRHYETSPHTQDGLLRAEFSPNGN